MKCMCVVAPCLANFIMADIERCTSALAPLIALWPFAKDVQAQRGRESDETGKILRWGKGGFRNLDIQDIRIVKQAISIHLFPQI